MELASSLSQFFANDPELSRSPFLSSTGFGTLSECLSSDFVIFSDWLNFSGYEADKVSQSGMRSLPVAARREPTRVAIMDR